MALENIVLAWRNRVDAGTLTGGSWLTTLPLVNLQNRQVQKVARSSNTLVTSTKLVIDLGQTRTIGVIALIVHNISVDGLVRICGNDTNSFASPFYDSDWIEAWPGGVIDSSLLEWEDDNFWLGTMSAEDRAGYQAPFIHRPDEAQALRYWQIEIDDTTNADAYIQIGRLFMAAAWSPTVNYLEGAGIAYSDQTNVEVSLSGAKYFDARPKPRTFEFEFGVLTSLEAFSSVLDLQQACGISGEVLLITRPDDTTNFVRRSFVGSLKSLGKIVNSSYGNYSSSFELEELL